MKNEGFRPDVVIHLRPTAPFRPPYLVDDSVRSLLDNPTADCVRCVVPAHQNPYKMYRIVDGMLTPLLRMSEFAEPYNMPRQKLPKTLWHAGHVEAIRYSTIMEKQSMSGDCIIPLVIDDKYAVALSMILLKKHLQHLREEDKDQNDLPFGILITSDEEIGGFDGARKVLREIKTDFCIVLDGGCIEKMVVKDKGLVKLRLVSRAKAGGSPQSWRGENAVEKLLDDFIKIRNYCVRSVPENPHRAVNFCSIRSGKNQQSDS